MTNRRIIPWLAGSIGFLAVFALLLAFFLPYLVESQAVEHRVRGLLAEKIGASVRFEKIAFTWLPWPAVSIRGLAFSMAENVKGTAANIEVRPSIYGLFTGRLLIWRLNVQSLAISARIPERGDAPFSVQELEERIRAGLMAFASDFPGVRLRIEDGSAEIRFADGRPLVVRGIDGWIGEASSNLELSLSVRSDFSRRIRVSGKITDDNLAADARLVVEQLRLREVYAALFPHGPGYIEDGNIDLDLQLSALGLREFKAVVRGAMPSLTLAHEGGKALIEGKNFAGTVVGDERMIRTAIERFELLSPPVDLSGEFLLDRASSAAKLTLAGRNADAEKIRALALRVAGTSASVKEIFRYVHGGNIPEVRIETKGRSLAEMSALRNMVVRARVRDGEVFIPALDLNLVAVDGSLAIADGVLESQDLAARQGKTRIRDGKLRLGFNPRDSVMLQLDMMVESEAAEAHRLLRGLIKNKTYLNEASKIRNLEGEIAGKLILDGPVDSLVAKIHVSKADLKAWYEPVPFPITVKRGRFNYDDGAIRVENLDATLGRSSISKFSGFLSNDATRRLVVESASLSVDVEQTHSLLRRFANLAVQWEDMKSLRGRVELASFSLSGPLNDPGRWEFRGAGKIDGLVMDHAGFPGPITLAKGKFDTTASRLAFSEVEADMLDASVAAAGFFENPIKGPLKIEGTGSGILGERILQWLRRKSELPEKLAPRAPLKFTEGQLRWGVNGLDSLRGRVAIADGPNVYLDIERSPHSIAAKEITVENEVRRARMAFAVAEDRLELSFAGVLDQKTLREIFLVSPLKSGRIDGDIKASYHLNPPLRFSALGKLQGKSLALPLDDGVVDIDSFSIEGGGESLMLRTTDLRWRGSRFSLSGRATALKDGLKFDMDAAADRITWEDISVFTGGRGGGGKYQSEDMRLPRIEGAVRLKAEEFIFKRYRSRPLHVDLEVSPRGGIAGQVKRSIVCGIRAAGSFDIESENVGVDLRLSVTDGQLEPTSRCLTNEQVQGTYSLKADLKGTGDPQDLLRSLKGDLELIARDGRFIRSSGVAAAFDHLNSTGNFNVEFPDLHKESFPYRSLSVKGTLNGPTFTADEVVIQGTSLTITGEGIVDLERNQIDAKGLVSVAAPGSQVLKKVPILGSVLGGSLVGIPMRVSGPLDNPEASYLSPEDVGAELLNMPLRILGLPVEAIQIFTPGVQEK